jgi:hypothetical protein
MSEVKSNQRYVTAKYATVEHLGILLNQTEDKQMREGIKMVIEHMKKNNIPTAGEALISLGLVPAA